MEAVHRVMASLLLTRIHFLAWKINNYLDTVCSINESTSLRNFRSYAEDSVIRRRYPLELELKRTLVSGTTLSTKKTS